MEMKVLMGEIAVAVARRLGEITRDGWMLTVEGPAGTEDSMLVTVGTQKMTLVAIEGVFRGGPPYINMSARFGSGSTRFHPKKDGRFVVKELAEHVLKLVADGMDKHDSIMQTMRSALDGHTAYYQHSEALGRLPARWGHEAWNAESVQLSAGYVVPYDKLDAVTAKLQEIEAILRVGGLK